MIFFFLPELTNTVYSIISTHRTKQSLSFVLGFSWDCACIDLWGITWSMMLCLERCRMCLPDWQCEFSHIPTSASWTISSRSNCTRGIYQVCLLPRPQTIQSPPYAPKISWDCACIELWGITWSMMLCLEIHRLVSVAWHGEFSRESTSVSVSISSDPPEVAE